ncbi:MAG TPA: tetratricopeptide repeat protein [bacterium]
MVNPSVRVRFQTLRPLVLLSALVLMAFWGAWRGGFLWDDRLLILEHELVRDWRRIPEAWAGPLTADFGRFYRPLLAASFGLSHALWGDAAAPYHLENLILHTANVWLVYALAAALAHDARAGLLAAAIFAVHPLQSEPVNYLSSRGDLLAAAGIFASVLLYVRARAGSGGRRAYAASMACFVLGALAKEIAFIVPALAAAYEVTLSGRGAGGRRWKPVLGLMIAAAGMLALRGAVLHAAPAGGNIPGTIADVPVRTRLLTALSVLPLALRLTAWPVGLHKVWEIPLIGSPSDPRVWIGIAAALGAAALLRFAWRTDRPAAFGLAWAVLCWLPYANLIPLNAFFSEHWMYLPLFGLALAFASAAVRAMDRSSVPVRRASGAALAGIIAVFGWMTAERTAVWAGDPVAFYEEILRYSPGADRIHNELGNLYLERGKPERAGAAYEAALERNPLNAGAWYNRGRLHALRGELDEAAASYARAIAQKPGFALAHNNLGGVLYRQRRLEEAEQALRDALRLEPDLFEAHHNLGNVHRARGELMQASHAYAAALARNPRYAPSHAHLGETYLKLGRAKDASASLRRALELDPASVTAWNDLGGASTRLGSLDAAAEAYAMALALDPGYAPAQYNLGLVLRELGRNQDAREALSRAAGLFEELGRGDMAERAREALEGLGANPAQADGETGSE